jgi:hypothetical protein
MSEAALIEAIRASSPATQIRLLHELLKRHLMSGGRPAPTLSPEREAELNERMKHLDDSRDLRDYIAELGSRGGSS